MCEKITLYPIFRHWGEANKIWILSDLHLDDEDRLLMVPDWIDGRTQVEIINQTVGKDDTFVCLGDVGEPTLVGSINAGRKVLLLGNHDRKPEYEGLFHEIYEGPVFISDRVLLSHEPVPGLTFCLNIHGHCHSGKEQPGEGCRHLNMAANLVGYRPMRLADIIEKTDAKSIRSIHDIG